MLFGSFTLELFDLFFNSKFWVTFFLPDSFEMKSYLNNNMQSGKLFLLSFCMDESMKLFSYV